MSKWFRRLWWAAVGAVIGYFVDPISGRSRRARLRDQVGARLRAGGRAVARKARWRAGKVKGVLHRLWRSSGEAPRDDETLLQKVRSEAVGVVDGPVGDVDVRVDNGVVYLTGAIDDAEIAHDLVQRIRGVTGVRDIRSELSAGWRRSELVAGVGTMRPLGRPPSELDRPARLEAASALGVAARAMGRVLPDDLAGLAAISAAFGDEARTGVMLTSHVRSTSHGAFVFSITRKPCRQNPGGRTPSPVAPDVDQLLPRRPPLDPASFAWSSPVHSWFWRTRPPRHQGVEEASGGDPWRREHDTPIGRGFAVARAVTILIRRWSAFGGRGAGPTGAAARDGRLHPR
jgi:hyperosmotically inducible periplasmic protein